MLCAPIAGLFWSTLHFGKNQGKRKGTPISAESALVSGFGPALGSRESCPSVWSSGAVVYRLTESPTLRYQIVLPLAPIGSPMAVGDLAFTSLIPQVSLHASSQGKEVGEQASLDALVLSVARFFDVSSRLAGLLHRASSTQGRMRGIEILYRRRWEENWRGMHSTS
jgi:hypothetical protein